jgi:NADPH-dependent ferric siderophore reductase
MTTMAAPPDVETPVRPKRDRKLMTLSVLRTEQLTPHMVRVVAGGDGFDDFVPNGFTDAYVKLAFERPDAAQPIDWSDVAALPRDERPVMRTYTVRSHDPVRRELAIDFVVHGDEGIAAPWADHAQPGDLLRLRGPGGAYAPRTDVDWHLLVGDEAALPAIAVALEAMTPEMIALVIIEVANADEELPLDTRAAADIRWLHRDDSSTPTLFEAATALVLPPGTGQGFVHGELRTIRELRTHFLADGRFEPELLSISGYWSRGKTEDGFQAEKAAGGA